MSETANAVPNPANAAFKYDDLVERASAYMLQMRSVIDPDTVIAAERRGVVKGMAIKLRERDPALWQRLTARWPDLRRLG